MKNVKNLALSAVAVAAMSGTAFAADRSDLHGSDYKWMQFNAMYAVDEHPIDNPDADGHNYLEMEFGGRSGVVDLYGYVDVFDIGENNGSDKNGGSKMFMKLAPRFSLDAIFGTDLSFGPVEEVYFSTLFNWGGGEISSVDGEGDVNMSFFGLGADVMVPWLGKTGVNLYATYDGTYHEWNGYQFSANWFKPFYFFDNKSFLSFQGYVDWQFGMDENISGLGINGAGEYNHASEGGAVFLGLYWHTDRYALGYGAKYFSDVYGLNNHAFADSNWSGLDTTGWAHYFTASYKF